MKNDFQYQGENAPLVHAMHRVATNDSPTTRRKLYEVLLASILIIPTPEIPGELRGRASVKTTEVMKVDIVGFTDQQGKRVTPAFTDAEALRAWDPNTPSLRIASRNYFELVQGTNFDSIVINPFDPIREMLRPGGLIHRTEFDLLAKGLTPTPIPSAGVRLQFQPGQKVFLGIPAVRPNQEVETLLRLTAAQHPEISELHLFQLATLELGSNTVVGILIDKFIQKEQEASIRVELGQAVQSNLGSGSMDFMILEGGFIEKVRRNSIVIYRRS